MFTPKYVDLRALSSVVASRIYAFFVASFAQGQGLEMLLHLKSFVRLGAFGKAGMAARY